jgi:hypothetical protein
MATAETIRIATEARQTLAGKALTEHQAKLYSQSLRRSMGQEGLRTFSQRDIPVYLNEAILLLQCALLEQGAVPNGSWQEGIKRAAEILEWLSRSDLRPTGFPIHFLSAAAYQVAGYPAMALAQLQHMPDEPFSKLLREFLRANFPVALEAVHGFWKDQRVLEEDGLISESDLSVLAVRHTVMCLGTVLTYFRTGDYGNVERALRKLDRIAAGFLHSRDPFSYLLAQLTAAACRRYIEMCLWVHITELRMVSTPQALDALVQYARVAFLNRRILVWPAQATGISRLRENASFVLCTPTGSGKTTVATLAVVQGLNNSLNQNTSEGDSPGNLVLYLVPSRALAAEVEARLGQDLRGISAEPVIVTGLYGGLDWGPTDAWVQTERPTILVCTFEKADALLRYLGVLFLNRVRLVLVDEVHMVEQGGGPLVTSSRAYRLEQLGTRLLRAQDSYGFRIVALSAVAGHAAPALARWIGGNVDASPTTSDYRSTRQMLGHLIVERDGRFSIHYDLMNGRSLKFSDERPNESPYVPSPFPPMPGGVDPNAGPEVAMRAPTLWAALHLAAERSDGARPSVLISVTQNIEAFAATCADELDRWQNEQLPRYRAVDEMDERWIRCLASAADYFSRESVEYRLLKRGIAVHHGKMPGLLARRLKILIDCGYLRIIIATSTLSEGVNLPVNYLLIPSVCRGQACMDLQEFRNLIGRAGRPGFAAEGHALVVLPQRTYQPVRYGRVRSRQWEGYGNLTSRIEAATTTSGGTPRDESSSPL